MQSSTARLKMSDTRLPENSPALGGVFSDIKIIPQRRGTFCDARPTNRCPSSRCRQCDSRTRQLLHSARLRVTVTVYEITVFCCARGGTRPRDKRLGSGGRQRSGHRNGSRCSSAGSAAPSNRANPVRSRQRIGTRLGQCTWCEPDRYKVNCHRNRHRNRHPRCGERRSGGP